jgi:transposase InsO family protein
MPWNEVTKMSLKLEFVRFALKENEPFSALCKRYNISRKTGYKLLQRYAQYGESGLSDQSRKPKTSPSKSKSSIEKKIVKLREEKPSWGGRKIKAYLLAKGEKNMPAASTITNILQRYNLISKKDTPEKAYERFEHVQPNDLWQVDFKGHFAMHRSRCYPLTILDDHSRYCIGIKACAGERSEIVTRHFEAIFEEHGLPYRMNFDNGSPWANVTSKHYRFTEFTLWLIRLGIDVSFSRIRRPQTNGKLERFHRTLKSELLQYNYFKDLKHAQREFDKWRREYNFERPHEGIDMKTPFTRYQYSVRKYVEKLPEIEYRDGDIIRHVDSAGKISYQNRKIVIGQAFRHLPVALRTTDDIEYSIYFCHMKLFTINMRGY